MTDIIRVLRVIEYIGPRDAVNNTIARSIHGTRQFGRLTIHASVVAGFPEIEFRQPTEEDNDKEPGIELTDEK